MAIDVRQVLTSVAFRPKDMDALLDPNLATYARFDPEMGYVPDLLPENWPKLNESL